MSKGYYLTDLPRDRLSSQSLASMFGSRVSSRLISIFDMQLETTSSLRESGLQSPSRAFGVEEQHQRQLLRDRGQHDVEASWEQAVHFVEDSEVTDPYEKLCD